MREDGKRITCTMELSRKEKLERGAPEQQMATYELGNCIQEDPHCLKCL